jgi:hypothetical protein
VSRVTWPFHALPAFTFFWMMMRAGLVFTPDAGRRDGRGLGIALSMWGALGVSQLAYTPPLWIQSIGAAGLTVSLALYDWAARSIRGRLFSFAGNHDLPQFVHQSGPYSYVRNPFYLSYLLAEISTLVMWPSPSPATPDTGGKERLIRARNVSDSVSAAEPPTSRTGPRLSRTARSFRHGLSPRDSVAG